MNVIQALVLGIVQGLTEFIPVSSSAHLIIVPWLFPGWPDPGLAFDVALHLGTLAAVLIYFWRDLIELLRCWVLSLPRLPGALREDAQARLAWMLIIASIPGAITGVLLDTPIEDFFHGATTGGAVANQAILIVAGLLAVLGVLLYMAERLARHECGINEMTWRDAILIGLAQALAVLPGVSRSGSTITAGLWAGLKRDDAARFSFLLSLPIIAGAGLKKVYDVLKAHALGQAPADFVVGMLAAAIVGYLAIAFLLRYLRRNSTDLFAYYRWALAALLVVLVIARG